MYENIVEKQKKYFAAAATRPKEFRIYMLEKLYDAVKKREKEIAEALKADFGKSAFETYASESGIILDEIKFIKSRLPRWMRAKRAATNLLNMPGSSKIYPEPYGCTLIIAPWNYPFQLAVSPLLGAMAAGNCAIVKPSELSPHTSHVLAELINAAFDEEYIAVVEGGKEETQALLEHKFDYILYTGGAHVGRIIMESAAKHLTPVTLELGGKSPCIVHENASLKTAVKRIMWGKFFNAGQTCVAPDYLYVHESVKGRFLEYAVDTVREFYGEDPHTSPDYARIVNDRHFNRLKALLDSGDIVTGGKTIAEERYIAPTIIDNVTWDDPVMQEEIFGPLLPVLSYSDIDEVIDSIRGKPHPLALYCFTHSKHIEQRVVGELQFGGGAVNDTVMQFSNPHLPFGGIGKSGIGAYHGRHSFDTFTHYKGVHKKMTLIDIPLRYPPYKNKKNLLKMILR